MWLCWKGGSPREQQNNITDMDNRYNPVIFSKLKVLASQSDWQGMLAYLRSLSHSGFRTASYILKERVLPMLDANDFWQCFSDVALTDTKAFLMTFLQAATKMYLGGSDTNISSSGTNAGSSNTQSGGSFSFDNPLFLAFANKTATLPTSLDRKKSLLLLLPIMKTPEEISRLLNAFCLDDNKKKIPYLVESKETPQCYFVLFQLLRQCDGDMEYMRHTLSLILKRSTPMAFNFVSLARSYFGVEGLNGRFSLRLESYELSRLESDYPTFLKSLERMIAK